jgi:putative phage-type endonuclease
MRRRAVTAATTRLYELLRAEGGQGIAQRTPAWYSARTNMVTASDFAQALGRGKFGSQKALVRDKCGYDVTKAPDFGAAPLRWGTKYEPVAQAVYAAKMGCMVHEFGLLRHPDVPFFGASPDGVTDRGVMVEIKCPWRREMTGEVPEQYFYQIQGQLAVCGLEECDYVECKFVELDYDEWCADNTSDHYGRVVEISDGDGGETTRYEYAHGRDALPTPSDDATAVTYWKLVKWSVVRVSRDRDFFDAAIRELEIVWRAITSFRANEGAYRAYINNRARRALLHETVEAARAGDDDDAQWVSISGFHIRTGAEFM